MQGIETPSPADNLG